MKAKRIIKSGLALLLSMQLALMSCITALAAPEWPSGTGVLADIGIAVDADSGAVLFGQGIHELTPPGQYYKASHRSGGSGEQQHGRHGYLLLRRGQQCGVWKRQ